MTPTLRRAKSHRVVSAQIMTALAHLPGMGVAGDGLPLEASKQHHSRHRHHRDCSESTPCTGSGHRRRLDHTVKRARVCRWVPAPGLQGDGQAGGVPEQQAPMRQEQAPMARQVRAATTCERARSWVGAPGLQRTGCAGNTAQAATNVRDR